MLRELVVSRIVLPNNVRESDLVSVLDQNGDIINRGVILRVYRNRNGLWEVSLLANEGKISYNTSDFSFLPILVELVNV